MRAVVQRVRDASVVARGVVTGSTPWGLLVYLAVGRGDTEREVSYMSEKVSRLRIFPDAHGKMNLSLLDIRSESYDDLPGVLVVSQFTLYGDVSKGRRPSYNEAAEPAEATRLYEMFLDNLRSLGVHPESGVFGEHMDVTYTNDGPVTILIDTSR